MMVNTDDKSCKIQPHDKQIQQGSQATEVIQQIMPKQPAKKTPMQNHQNATLE